jgi:DNA-binding response OmpR family regulator
MGQRATRVLLVAEDPVTITEITAFLTLNLEADLTVVDSLKQAEVLAAGNGFDLALVASELSDGNGLCFLRGRKSAGSLPIIMLDEQPDAERVLEALRAGAADVFTRPFDMRHMRGVVRRTIKNSAAQKKLEVRNRRLRKLSSRLVRDRRELRQRIDLICRDVVLAYRRLVEKTMKSPGTGLTAESRADFTADPHGRIDSLDANP